MAPRVHLSPWLGSFVFDIGLKTVVPLLHKSGLEGQKFWRRVGMLHLELMLYFEV